MVRWMAGIDYWCFHSKCYITTQHWNWKREKEKIDLKACETWFEECVQNSVLLASSV